MQKTNDSYDIVLRLGKKSFLIFKDVFVLYDPESTWWVDDRIKRIDQKVYAGDLIQNHDGIVLDVAKIEIPMSVDLKILTK